jgi:hypothetical protein
MIIRRIYMNSMFTQRHNRFLGSMLFSLFLLMTLLCSSGFAQKEVVGGMLSGATVKPDIETLQGVWKDTNSRSRNMRISIVHGRISIYCWDTQDSEVTQVSNILWKKNALHMVMYTPSTGYRNNVVLRVAGQNELRGRCSGSWNGDILWIRLPGPDS